MKEILSNSIKLCLITLISGLLLGMVYEITKTPRADQEEKTKQEAYKKVFKNADSFDDFDYEEKDLKKYLKDHDCSSGAEINDIVTAKDKSGNEIGYVVTVTDKEGYGGDIKFTFGIQKDGTINGISFLSISETAGVGMKAKESKFKKQFEGRNVEKITYTKTGAKDDTQIDAISGATITTNAVTNGVNAGIMTYKFITESSVQGGQSNE